MGLQWAPFRVLLTVHQSWPESCGPVLSKGWDLVPLCWV